jgi:hypothetical protein
MGFRLCDRGSTPLPPTMNKLKSVRLLTGHDVGATITWDGEVYKILAIEHRLDITRFVLAGPGFSKPLYLGLTESVTLTVPTKGKNNGGKEA